MLRLPGTWNRKLENPNGPVLVTFEDCGRRYTVEELRELVPSARPPISTPKAVVAPSAHAYTPDEWAQLGYEQIPRLGGRNNAGYWLASQLRDDRYDSETCWSAMQQYHRLAEGWPADHRYTIAEAQASLQSALNGEPRDPHPRAFLHAEGVDWADKSDAKQLPTRLVDGAEFVFQESDMVASVWGDGSQVLWASGEGCMIDAQQGLGKTTLAQQLVLARIGVRPASLLGFPVATDDRPVLYLAMDRPRQAARSLRRMVGEVNRELLRERLRVWRGPLPFNLLQDFRKLANFVDDVGAGLVAIDSVKDLAPGLSKDEVGSGINQAWQEVIARGVELLALHHQRKDQQGTAKKHALSDVYGSEWLTAGLGSVLVLVGSPGGEVVELRQLKMPVDEVGPLHLLHDHATGTTRLTGDFPKLRDVLALHPQGLTVKALAEVCRLNEKVVQRQLASLEKQGLAERSEGGHTARGRDPDLWRLTPQGRWAADQKP
jgi:replicative DNA helicase